MPVRNKRTGGDSGGNTTGDRGVRQRPDPYKNRPPRYYDKNAKNRLRADPVGQELDDLLQKFADYEYPEELLNRRLNTVGGLLTAQEQAQMRAYQEAFAGRTGGRMSAARGMADIGGQAAMARSAAYSDIIRSASETEFQAQLAALQAYIQKYGYDKNAEIALKQLKAQRDMAEADMLGEGLGTLALLPFLAKSVGWL